MRRKPKSPYRAKSKPKAPPKPKRQPAPTVDLPPGGVAPSAGAYMLAGMDARISAERHRSREDAGRLRGGSVGCVLPGQDANTGEYTGTCVRAAAARFLGAEAPHPTDEWRISRLMFDFGHMSEDYFWTDFAAGLPPGLVIKREEEYPILDDVAGVQLTGREDQVVVDPETGLAELFVENKNVSSLPTDLLFGEMPKLEHLIQLGNYCRIESKKQSREVPAQLWYTSRVKHSLPTQWKWVSALLPRFGDTSAPGYAAVEWSRPRYVGDTPLPTKIKPFYLGFHIRLVDGVLHYSVAHTSDSDHEPRKWVRTGITSEGIVAHYKRVLDCAAPTPKHPLPAPPIPYTAEGERKTYRACDYCDWAPVCASIDPAAKNAHGQWREAVLLHVEPELDQPKKEK